MEMQAVPSAHVSACARLPIDLCADVVNQHAFVGAPQFIKPRIVDLHILVVHEHDVRPLHDWHAVPVDGCEAHVTGCIGDVEL